MPLTLMSGSYGGRGQAPPTCEGDPDAKLEGVMADDNPIALLQATLSRRDTPETVAELIERILPPRLARHIHGLLQVRIANSIERWFGWSSMPTTFEAPVQADRLLAKARELAVLFLGGTLPEVMTPPKSSA